jgi:F-type H+-transporting ATPase subunit epsilon
MSKLLVEIITPQRQAFSQEVDAITVPTTQGTVGVLAKHVPLFTSLSDGEIKLTTGAKEYYLAIGGGFMEVTRGRVSILVSRAAHAHELNEAQIRKAQEAARDVIKRRAKGAELANAQAVLRRSLIELKVFKRRKASPVPPASFS